MRLPDMAAYTKVVHAYIEESTLSSENKSKLSGWLRAKRWDLLSSCASLPEFEYQLQEARALLQVEAFFKKLPTVGDEAVRRSNAQNSFERAERICRITNRRLEFFERHPDRLDRELASQISRMKSFIHKAAGDWRLYLDSLPTRIRVTSGATQDRSRQRSLPFLKISGKVRAPNGALGLISGLYRYFGADSPVTVPTEFNRIQLVPKNWKTHRTIACEATHVVPVQLALDSFWKERLRLFGVNLQSQERNQKLARIGSIDGSLATVDMEMASDTVALNCVAILFGPGWLRVLSVLRARLFKAPWGEGCYAKYSSMGNGVTFVLETLIFLAACKAVGSKEPAVYGDDIVIETELVPKLRRLLRHLGFRMNEQKTHVSGPFRESCGVNCYSGVDITPFYVRELPNCKARLNHFVNGLASVSEPNGRVWSALRDLVVSHRLPLVPYSGESVSGVWVDVPTAYRAKVITMRHSLLYVRSYCTVGKRRINRGWRSLILWHLHTIQPQGSVARGNFEESTFAENVTSSMSLGHVKYRIRPRIWHPWHETCPSWVNLWSEWITG